MKNKSCFALLVLQVFMLCSITLFCVAPISCKLTEEGVLMTGGDYEPPSIVSFDVVDEKSVRLMFSEGVKIDTAVVSKQIENVSDSMEHSSSQKASAALEAAAGANGTINSSVVMSEDNLCATILMEESCEIGAHYELYGCVSDKIGNSLTFCVPFTGYNCFVPKLIMSELQIKYAKGTLSGKAVFRSEYIEFVVLEDGNLGGLELVSGSDGEDKKYCFPAIEVKKGQVFLVHFRTMGEGCVDERENLSEASAIYSVQGVLDLWSGYTSASFNDNSDVLILRNGCTGEILDGFMYCSPESTEWKTGPAEFAKLLANAQIYESGNVFEAALSKGVTAQKTFQRQNVRQILESVNNQNEIEYPIKNNSDFWVIKAASPGEISEN
ncbi:MAG: hypothetical protein J6X84_03805 [Treponema sp.]|nr:hypothetical protein [Treponema sp.]